MTTLSHVALVGLPAVGKSSIGRRLAKVINRPFFDTDELAEQECGRTIAEMFSTIGESEFREMEHRILERALMTQSSRIVLATGGGVVLDSRNRRLLRDQAFTVYLNGAADTLVARLKRSKRRPLFENADIDEKLQQLRVQRAAHYADVARLTVDVDRRPMRELVDTIATRLLEHESVAS